VHPGNAPPLRHAAGRQTPRSQYDQAEGRQAPMDPRHEIWRLIHNLSLNLDSPSKNSKQILPCPRIVDLVPPYLRKHLNQ
jgi:hypothetical protein